MPLTYAIDGSDITQYVLTGQWKPRWNMMGTAVVRALARHVGLKDGASRLAVYLNGTLVHCGPCGYSEAEGNADSAYVEITSHDDLVYLKDRLCKTSTGNLITPGTVLEDEVTAPAILAAFINNANSVDPIPMPLTPGSVSGGGVDVSGAPQSFPMSIRNMMQLLVSTGQLDVKVNPGLSASTVDLTNGGGLGASGASYEYATGAHNAWVGKVTVDMEDVISALWYLIGPKVTDQRWRGSITPTAANAGGDGPGGIPGTPWPASLLARIAASRALYNYRQEIRIFDDNADEYNIRPLFEAEWANEAWVRAVPRTFATVKPNRGTAPTFVPGQTINVAAGSVLGGGFAGEQFVYGMDVSCDHDGVVEVTDILASADQEGAP